MKNKRRSDYGRCHVFQSVIWPVSGRLRARPEPATERRVGCYREFGSSETAES